MAEETKFMRFLSRVREEIVLGMEEHHVISSDDQQSLNDMVEKLDGMYDTHAAIERRAEMEDKLRS